MKYIVNEEEILLKFLINNIENKSKNNVKSLIDRGNVSVNNIIITKQNYSLKKNDIVTVNYFNKIINLRKSIDIIYEDDEIIAINKPSGMLSISTNNEKENTAFHLVMQYLKDKNKNNRVFIVHRLDKDTSGVIMFAKNQSIKFAFQNKWDNLILKREYIAIVNGDTLNNDTIKNYLKENKNLFVYSTDNKYDGKLAITHYKKIKSNSKYSMLEINIDTGRKNQIRVHMKDIGHTIIGDSKYGDGISPIKRLGLHASRLTLKHPINNKIIDLISPIPKEFNYVFKGN